METFIREATKAALERNENSGLNKINTIASNNSIQRPANNNVDAELEQFLSQQKASIKVVGAGGAGNKPLPSIQMPKI